MNKLNVKDTVIELSKNMFSPNKLLDSIEEDNKKGERISIDLASGIPGILYLANEFNKNNILDKKETYIDDWIEILLKELKNNAPYDISLFEGLPGIAMSLVSLKRSDLDNVINQINNVIFQLIDYFLETLDKSFVNKPNVYDWMYGLSGTLNYLCYVYETFNQEKNCNKVIKYIEKIQLFVIRHYSKKIQLDSGTVYPWFISKNDQMESFEEEEYPFGSYNLSLSHGISGFLLALTKSQKLNYSFGIEKIQDSISVFILNNMFNDENVSIWPLGLRVNEKYEVDVKQQLNRFDSWCYGSPGILLGLLQYSEQKKDKNLKDFCLNKLMLFNNDIEGINSPIVCHGFSGVLLLLNMIKRKYKLDFNINEKIPKKILNYKDINLNLFFKDKRYVSREKYIYISDPGILNGTSGIILSLLSCEYKPKSDWQKLFGFL